MSYRSLLVHIDHDRRADARTAYALRMARALGCRVVGATPTGAVPHSGEVTFGVSESLTDAAEAVWNALDERARAAQARFVEACGRAGMAAHDGIVEHGDKVQSLVRLAHCSDIVVLSQADPEGPDFATARELVAEVVLRSARPTVILPFAGEFETVPSQVLVAWNDSREAARAIADALPLLRASVRVQVVTWSGSAGAAEPDWHERHAALQRWLGVQGVAAETRLAHTGHALAEAILSRASDFGADLIVMGAYGHRRWIERMGGGTTQAMLASMTVPVLMSH